jgi:hypothetical protein
MSAYNWIEIEDYCPSCKKKSLIKCQTHFCSEYDGDDSGRFHDRTYKLGDRMAWWPISDKRFSGWRESNLGDNYGCDASSECCCSECMSCGAELFVVIDFVECSPSKVLNMGLEIDWPEEYLK